MQGFSLRIGELGIFAVGFVVAASLWGWPRAETYVAPPKPATAAGAEGLRIGSPDDCEITQRPDSLVEFAAKCKAAIGIDVPPFRCDDRDQSTEVEEGHVTGSYPNAFCDRPNVLNQECDPGSRFQVLVQTPEVSIVAHCRKKGFGSDFGDVAVIQYNKVNGNTCFYQSPIRRVSADVPAPSSGRPFWLTPSDTAGINCVGCHDNGPFIRSPYLAHLRDEPKNRLPGTNPGPGPWDQRFSWNRTIPYRFVGADFQAWKVYAIEPQGPGSACTSCHRMGLSSNASGLATRSGTSLDLGLRATAKSQTFKHPHSPDAPIWMKPGQVTYVSAVEDQAKDVARCAEAVALYANSPGSPPPSADCAWAQYGQGDTCKGPVRVPVNDPPGAPVPGPTGGTIPVPSCAPGTPGCPIGLCYWVSVHGPFWQASDGAIPSDDPRFRGSLLRLFIDGDHWAVRYWSDATGLPPQVAPGGHLECVATTDIAAVPDPAQCYGNPFELFDRDGSIPDDRLEISLWPAPWNVLSGMIGNVAQQNGQIPDHVRVTEEAGRFFLEQHHRTAPPPLPPLRLGPLTAEAFTYGCDRWKPSFVARDIYTESDIQLVPSGSSRYARCFLTGLSGAWSSTRRGGTEVPRAEIYTTSSGEIRLRVSPARDASDHVGAWASCLKIN